MPYTPRCRLGCSAHRHPRPFLTCRSHAAHAALPPRLQRPPPSAAHLACRPLAAHAGALPPRLQRPPLAAAQVDVPATRRARHAAASAAASAAISGPFDAPATRCARRAAVSAAAPAAISGANARAGHTPRCRRGCSARRHQRPHCTYRVHAALPSQLQRPPPAAAPMRVPATRRARSERCRPPAAASAASHQRPI